MSGLFCASLVTYIPNVTFSRTPLTTYSKSSQMGARMTEWDQSPPLCPVYIPIEREKGQKQVKKKAFKINAKIEDVGLNKYFKKYGNKKRSLNFHEKPKSQNPTYCFSVLHRIKIKQYHT